MKQFVPPTAVIWIVAAVLLAGGAAYIGRGLTLPWQRNKDIDLKLRNDEDAVAALAESKGRSGPQLLAPAPNLRTGGDEQNGFWIRQGSEIFAGNGFFSMVKKSVSRAQQLKRSRAAGLFRRRGCRCPRAFCRGRGDDGGGGLEFQI